MSKTLNYYKVTCTNGKYLVSSAILASSSLLAGLLKEKKPLVVSLTTKQMELYEWAIVNNSCLINPIKFSTMRAKSLELHSKYHENEEGDDGEYDKLFSEMTGWNLETQIEATEAFAVLKNSQFGIVYKLFATSEPFHSKGIHPATISNYLLSQGEKMANAPAYLTFLERIKKDGIEFLVELQRSMYKEKMISFLATVLGQPGAGNEEETQEQPSCTCGMCHD